MTAEEREALALGCFESGRAHDCKRVEWFHRHVIGIETAPEPTWLPGERHARARLIAEEACEVVAALIGGWNTADLFAEMLERVEDAAPSLSGYCHEAADLRVVLHGSDLRLGVHGVACQVFDAVCHANDAKAGGPKDPTTGKQLKPPGWRRADVPGILRRVFGWVEP